MPASTPRWPSRPAGPSLPRRDLRGDSSGVSEVVGFLLIFGVLSMVLLLAMVAFGYAKEAADENAVGLRAESAAARVAAVVVQTAVLAEQESTSSLAVSYRIDLPDQFEGRDYSVVLDPAAGSDPDLVRVRVPSLDLDVTAPLFAAGAPAGLYLCETTADGGTLEVRYDAVTASTTPTHTSCGVASGTKVLFLEVS